MSTILSSGNYSIGTNKYTSSCSFALWRLIDVAKTGAGAGTDPTFNEPGPILLSTAEIYLAATCSTIPFFWPVVRDQFNKIFVKYEFNITSESYCPDEEIQLANTGSSPAGSGRDEARSVESFGRSKMGKTPKASYKEVFIQEQVASFDASKKVFPSGGITITALGDK